MCASIVQHGHVTEELYFSPDHFSGSPVRLYPRGRFPERSALPVLVNTTSSDRRYNGKEGFAFVFRVSANGTPVPKVRVTSPADSSAIDGPAFVSARAEADVTNGVQSVAVFLGHKRLGQSSTPVCSVAVERAAGRLGGTYTLWARPPTPKRLGAERPTP